MRFGPLAVANTFTVACFLSAVVVVFGTLAYATLKNSRKKQKAAEPVKPNNFRCGTPTLQNGGSLICHYGDFVEIVTREGTETLTVDEYNARKAARTS